MLVHLDDVLREPLPPVAGWRGRITDLDQSVTASEWQPSQVNRYDAENDDGDDECDEHEVFFWHSAFRRLNACEPLLPAPADQVAMAQTPRRP